MKKLFLLAIFVFCMCLSLNAKAESVSDNTNTIVIWLTSVEYSDGYAIIKAGFNPNFNYDDAWKRPIFIRGYYQNNTNLEIAFDKANSLNNWIKDSKNRNFGTAEGKVSLTKSIWETDGLIGMYYIADNMACQLEMSFSYGNDNIRQIEFRVNLSSMSIGYQHYWMIGYEELNCYKKPWFMNNQ